MAGGLAFLLSSPGQVAVGASGAIFGLFGAWLAASWVNRDTPQGRAGLSQFGMLLLINLALPLFIPNIAWQAHMGGLVAGLLVGFSWARRNRSGDRPTLQARLKVPLIISVALLVGLLWYTMA
jgi:membrane associated rhomboid family serine protease